MLQHFCSRRPTVYIVFSSFAVCGFSVFVLQFIVLLRRNKRIAGGGNIVSNLRTNADRSSSACRTRETFITAWTRFTCNYKHISSVTRMMIYPLAANSSSRWQPQSVKSDKYADAITAFFAALCGTEKCLAGGCIQLCRCHVIHILCPWRIPPRRDCNGITNTPSRLQTDTESSPNILPSGEIAPAQRYNGF